MNNQDSHITPEQFDKYLKGELSAEEAHAVEAAMQRHALYEEAMEGFESEAEATGKADLAADLDELRNLISPPAASDTKTRRPIPWWRMAAAAILLLISVPALWLLIEREGPLQNATEMAQDPTATEKESIAMEESYNTENDEEALAPDTNTRTDKVTAAPNAKKIDHKTFGVDTGSIWVVLHFS